MLSGGRLLADWVQARGFKTRKKAAEYLGISAGFLTMLIDGDRTPGRELSVRLQTEAGIQVAAWSLSPDDDPVLVEAGSTRKPKVNRR